MPFIVYTATGQQIKLEDKPLNSGGEGKLHKIITPGRLANHCVKIYHPQYQTKQREQKLRYMIHNQPKELSDGTNYMVCWVSDIVYIKSAFVGFIMPLAFNDSIQLYELCTVKIRKSLGSVWKQKFERKNSDSLEKRLKLCVNLSIAIHKIHSTGNYVLVDMKPQNILVSQEGKVSIVDLDSLQVSENGVVLHKGHVATPEYVPPEGKYLSPSKDFISETWDRFSLAVILYEFIFGIHPFVATGTGAYEKITTIDESIRNGLFVFGEKSGYLQIAPLHNNFKQLPQSLKICFLNAFDKGHGDPEARPSAQRWGEKIYRAVILETEKAVIKCPVCNRGSSVPKNKHTRFNCPVCNAKIEAKNGQIIGYVAEVVKEKVVYKERPAESRARPVVKEGRQIIQKSANQPRRSHAVTYILVALIVIGFLYLVTSRGRVDNPDNKIAATGQSYEESHTKHAANDETVEDERKKVPTQEVGPIYSVKKQHTKPKESPDKTHKPSSNNSNYSGLSNYTGSYEFKTTFDSPPSELPLRSKPSFSSEEIYLCPKDAFVYVIDSSVNEHYWKVYVDGYIGYLAKGHLKKMNDTGNTSKTSDNKNTDSYHTKESNYTGRYQFKATFDNPVFEIPLRAEPRNYSRKVYTCPKDAIVFVIDNSVNKDYCKAYVNGYTGYVAKAFLKKVYGSDNFNKSSSSNNSSSYDPRESSYTGRYQFKATFDNPVFEIPLRAEPRNYSRKVYTCPKDAIVFVIDNSVNKDYCKAYVNGYTGYVAKAFLKRKW